jgi:hypothetical protein
MGLNIHSRSNPGLTPGAILCRPFGPEFHVSRQKLVRGRRAHGVCTGAQGARRRRRCGDIVDDEESRDRRAIPILPSGSGRPGGICCVVAALYNGDCRQFSLKLHGDVHYLWTIPDAYRRSPRPYSVRHIEMGAADFLIAPGELIYPLNDVIDGPELPVVSMA